MANALARGVASSCRNPVLSLWTVVDGAVSDVEGLEFQVFDISTEAARATPVQVYPATSGDRATVDVGVTCPDPGAGRVRQGHYVAAWTPGGAEPLGRHRIVWYVQATAESEEQTFEEEFDVLAAGLTLRQPAYVLLSDLRDEGLSASAISDRRALEAITRWSRQIELWLRRSFIPRFGTYSLDGGGNPTQLLDTPVIFITGARYSDESDAVDADSYAVFNRHITQGLEYPDDRNVPRFTFKAAADWLIYQSGVYVSVWRRGVQNLRLSGVFGYTDFDPRSPVGVTPDLIRTATIMLVVRNYLPLADVEGRLEQQNAWRVNDIRTRDQSISYGPRAGASSGTGTGGVVFSGDPDIDALLENFVAPPFVGAV